MDLDLILAFFPPPFEKKYVDKIVFVSTFLSRQNSKVKRQCNVDEMEVCSLENATICFAIILSSR